MKRPIPQDEIEWINRYLQVAGLIDRSQVECIRNFSLMWNLFEGHVCEQRASLDKFEKIVNKLMIKGYLHCEDYKDHVNYFKSRYITNMGTNSIFDELYINNKNSKELVINVLLDKDTNIKSVVMALLIIIYRLRNNLFHGIKSLYTINNQVDNFKRANRILMRITELATGRI
jgi:hypothetical protein